MLCLEFKIDKNLKIIKNNNELQSKILNCLRQSLEKIISMNSSLLYFKIPSS